MVSFNVTHPLWLVTFSFQNADVSVCKTKICPGALLQSWFHDAIKDRHIKYHVYTGPMGVEF